MVGCGGRIPAAQADLYVGNSGTTARFLTALLTLGRGTYRLDGTPRMRERPIEHLLQALRQLGGQATCPLGSGCPPVLVQAHGLRGGRATVAGTVSSQFLSGLLLAAPYAESNVEIAIAGELVSRPYVEMTLRVMASFGVELETPEPNRFRAAAPRRYRGQRYSIEPDATAASYFFAAAAITRGEVTVEGLGRDSLQGDVAFCDCLERMGCRVGYGQNEITVAGGPLRGLDVDMNAISDTAQTLAVVALMAEGPTTIRGVAHIRQKETDRIHALATEIAKLGGGSRGTVRRLDDHAPAIAARGNRPARRPSHGHEFRAGRARDPRRRDRQPRLHGQDLSAVLCRFGAADRDARRGLGSRRIEGAKERQRFLSRFRDLLARD